MFVEGGFIYLLQRRDYRITKLSIESNKEVATFDFSALKDNNQSLYEGGDKYGLSEALLLTEDKIIIGLDNNGRSINKDNKWAKKYLLSSNQPAILIFNRPNDF